MGKVFKNLGRPDDVEILEPVKWVCEECGTEVWSSEQPAPLKWKDGHVCKYVKIVDVASKTE